MKTKTWRYSQPEGLVPRLKYLHVFQFECQFISFGAHFRRQSIGISSHYHSTMSLLLYPTTIWLWRDSHTFTFKLRLTLLKMSLVSTFDVKPEAFQEMLQNDTFSLEPHFSQYLSTINVGAARGEIHARCQQAGSEMANIILPPINLVEALPEPIVIKIQ